MRGVRKMSMVNLPQAMLSLWFHIGQLLPLDGDLTAPRRPVMMSLAFVAAFFSLSFGIADFVLYIWVDDAFVRENKKLVTIHYCVEIVARVPTLVFFHVTYRQLYGYGPTLLLFAGDVLITSLLLLTARFSQKQRRCCMAGSGTRHSLTQCLFSLVVAIPLFSVNVVVFDPGMMFSSVNHWVFYAVKYSEFVLMWYLIGLVRARSLHTRPSALWGTSILRLPTRWYDAFWWMNVVFVALNAVFVCCLVPSRRQENVRRITAPSYAEESGWAPLPVDPIEVRVAPVPSGSPSVDLLGHQGGRGITLLEHLEEVFELLQLLSKVNCHRNRWRLLGCIVDELWCKALPWDGTFRDEEGLPVSMALDPLKQAGVLIRRHGSDRASSPSSECGGTLVNGALVLPSGPRGMTRGFFDGKRLQWEDGRIWTKETQEPHEGNAPPKASAVLKLILPQLALALRWDDDGERDKGEDDLEAASRSAAAELSHRPLLGFLIRYGLVTQQADFMSDLYWALVCLSREEGEGEDAIRDLGYRRARLVLLSALRGDLDLLGHAYDKVISGFLRTVRRIIQGQREVWHQNMQLIMQHSGRSSGGGSWDHKTEALRSALRRWPELRRRALASGPSAYIPDADGALLRSPQTPCLEGDEIRGREGGAGFARDNSPHIDMVSPIEEENTPISLPIDPTMKFRGIVIEESEVIPSKQAPLMLTCKMSRTRSRLISSPHQSPRGDAEEIREKYLLKVGDDLRQDQLMLQMMALMSCVWQERLPPEDAQLLQIANFRVLAVTPQSGYVKFVADSVPLSVALRESQGNLAEWLGQHCPHDLSVDELMDNFCGSVAASCVATYILGIGDRHLENLCITRRGQLFHIDFGFVLGDDPKPMAPPVRLPQQVAQALLATDRLARCFELARQAYLALRPLAGLWCSILNLTAATGGAGCAKLAREPLAAVSGVRERLRVGQEDGERAASEFLCLMRESSEGLASILIDKVHAAGLFWR